MTRRVDGEGEWRVESDLRSGERRLVLRVGGRCFARCKSQLLDIICCWVEWKGFATPTEKVLPPKGTKQKPKQQKAMQ